MVNLLRIYLTVIEENLDHTNQTFILNLKTKRKQLHELVYSIMIYSIFNQYKYR